MDAALHSTILKILADAADMTIATVREDGYPQATTVSFASEGLDIYFGAGSGSQKARNIGRCNKVSLTVNRPYDDWDEIQGLSAGGLAESVTDPAELGKVGQLMVAKFPQVLTYAPSDASELCIFRVTMQVVSVLDYTKGFGHTDLVTLDSARAG